VMGDPSFQDQTNHIKIEGVTYTDTDPYDDDQAVDAFGDFDEVTRTVTITDGKLTLSPSSGCYNTKLMFIEVTPAGGGGGTATPGLAAATYKYDALGRRLQKSTGGVATTFVHDGDQVVAEYEGTTLKRRYIYGAYIDEPLAMATSAGTQYYHQSRIYSVMAMTNSSGQLAERYGYTPYGKRRVVSPSGSTLAASAVGNQVGFTGRYHDAETALTYFRARYQDAELGRFVGRDPLGYFDGANRYAFLRNSPANFFDPTGFGACAEPSECNPMSSEPCPEVVPPAESPPAPAPETPAIPPPANDRKPAPPIAHWAAVPMPYPRDLAIIEAILVAIAAAPEAVAIGIGSVLMTSDTPIDRTKDKPMPLPRPPLGRRERACRCTIRYAPADIFARCPDRVFGVGDGIDIGACQASAKNTAPVECRRYYGHCDWIL